MVIDEPPLPPLDESDDVWCDRRDVPELALRNVTDKGQVSHSPIIGLAVFAFLHTGDLSSEETTLTEPPARPTSQWRREEW